jgi:hypothetical protein
VGGQCEKGKFKMGGEGAKFMAMKIPRHCPLVLVKVGWREGKTFGCEGERWNGEELSRVPLQN